ncbi:hypothetical protein V1478_001755 [Vespula squamosa]|uniref:Uncharacterized protein n=1 Tax=Vespula squamosa TaxID=30214 RepID=A0ABD2BYM0_VESSQ
MTVVEVIQLVQSAYIICLIPSRDFIDKKLRRYFYYQRQKILFVMHLKQMFRTFTLFYTTLSSILSQSYFTIMYCQNTCIKFFKI